MSTSEIKLKQPKAWQSGIKRVVSNQLFIPIAALLALVIFNLIKDPSFFKITLGSNSNGDPVLSGYLINIWNNASELVILAIGMTLVTSATGGQDISVGATVAIAGSVALKVVCGNTSRPEGLAAPIIVAFLVAMIVSMLFGAFNGLIVAYFKIQPMVATLILFTAGRSIAAWIHNNELPVVSEPSFGYWGNFIPGIPIPTPVFVTIACIIVIALVLKFTNLRLYSQSVGINADSSRLNGINPQFIKFLTFVILGACVSVAGFLQVSRLSTINYSVVAKDIEMDVILAVALGGNNLGGGKFSMTASILGAYVIQFLNTTLIKYKVKNTAVPAYKAIVVIILIVISAPIVREKLNAFKKRISEKSKNKKADISDHTKEVG
ncbi:MAG: ABC transporter permease [Clostridiales bacterium]|nr:ABC transporter permease [Candidatus Scatonaster coprocaballi]